MGGKQICYCSTCDGKVRLNLRQLQRHRRLDLLRQQLQQELREADDDSSASDDASLRSGTSSPVPRDDISSVDDEPVLASNGPATNFHDSAPGSPAPSSAADDEASVHPAASFGKPAWPGNDKTTEKGYAKVMGKVFSDIALSQKKMSKVLAAFKSTVPCPNGLPVDFRQLLRHINPDLLEIGKLYICPNGCAGYSQREGHCGKCSDQDELVEFYFFDICEWLQKMYSDSTTARVLQSHKPQVLADDEVMWDVWQTKLWNKLFAASGCFGGDKRSVGLSLAVDGTSPFRSRKYSFWPLVVSVLNFPPNIRFNPFLSLVWGIMPASKKPRQLNGAFDIMVDQLDRLNRGIACVDSSSPVGAQTFELKGRLILLKGDYEGHSISLLGTGPNSLNPCLRCHIQSYRCQTLDKNLIGRCRRFCPNGSAVRTSRRNDIVTAGRINGSAQFRRTNSEAAPRPDDRSFLDTLSSMVEAQETSTPYGGFRGICALMKLPYFDPSICAVLDIGHMTDSLCRRFLRLFRCEHPEDGPKMRQFEKEMGRNRHCWMRENIVGPCGWSLDTSETAIADQRLATIRFPVNIDFNGNVEMFSRFSVDLYSSCILRAVRYKIFHFCLRGFLGVAQRRSFLNFVDLLAELLSPATLTDRLSYEQRAAEVLARIEDAFPMSLQVLHMHHVLHAWEGLALFGSVSVVGNMATDRLFKELKPRCHRKRSVELSLMKSLNVDIACRMGNVSELIPPDVCAEFEGLESTVSDSDKSPSEDARERAMSLYLRASLCGRFDSLPRLYGHSTSRLLDKSESEALLDAYRGLYDVSDDESKSIGLRIAVYSKAMLIQEGGFKVVHLRTEGYEVSRKLKSRSSYIMQSFAEEGSSSLERNRVPGLEGYYYYVGRIVSLWQHNFRGTVHEMAYVAWFEAPYPSDGGLWYVNTNKPFTSITCVPLDHLSGHQVVVAEEFEKLWVLSFV